jgi:Bacteriophage replication gene A protein (GPA)
MTPLSAQSTHFQRTTWDWRQLDPRTGEATGPKFEAFPREIQRLAVARLQELDTSDYKKANRFALQLVRELHQAHVGKAFDEAELRDCAENYAQRCATLRAGDPASVLDRLRGAPARFASCDGPTTWLPVRSPSYAAEMRSFAAKSDFARSVGIDPLPANRSNRYFGLSARLDDSLWWRRQLRKMWSRRSEEMLRKLGTVRKGADVYCSESALRLRASQQRRMRQFLQGTVAINELGESLSLEQLAEHSLSNPALRRGELMARIKGYEQIANELGWCGLFVTVTAPSYFHPQRFHGGANPNYGGATVREAQQWLCRTWSRVRAQLDRDGVRYFGIRVAEPHHDGTPHWHMLLFVHRAARKDLTRTIVSGWLKEYGTEPGAYAKRVTVKRIDPSKGSATGYLAKYIAKNLDAAGAIHAAEGGETGVGGQVQGLGHNVAVADGLTRVLAWASVHGVRQFQQLGGPPVGLYREARRVRDVVSDRDVERARRYADRGDWRGFCLASGYRFHWDYVDRRLERLWRVEQRRRRRAGLPRRRRDKTDLRMVYAETGRRNRYGELVGCQIIGLKWSAAELYTRPHSWRLQSRQITTGTVHKNSVHDQSGKDARSAEGFSLPLGPVAITVRTSTDDVDPVVKWFGRTESLIRQLACQFHLTKRPTPQLKWGWDGDSSRLVKGCVRAESTGPPH